MGLVVKIRKNTAGPLWWERVLVTPLMDRLWIFWAWNPDASIKVAHPRKPPWLVPLTRAFIDLLADPVPGGYPGR